MKLFLIDGHALVFKMYYAFLGRPMVNSKGVDTSILFGFTKYLLELIKREEPSHLAVSFDPPGGTFRNRMYPEYKANRGETPQLVIDALEPLTGIVKSLGIPVLMVKDFEADDVIGTAAKRFASEGFEVYMVTPDKDYGQLVAPGIFQYKPGKAGGENEVLGEAEVCAKWGIERTEQVVDVLAICGDSSDNVPGVQGVGPVGAAKLLAAHGNVQGIYDHLDALTPRMRSLFEAARDHIGLSRELVTIRTDVPIDVTADEMRLNAFQTPEFNALVAEYEMFSLKKLLPEKAGAPKAESRKVTVSGTTFLTLNLKGGELWLKDDSGVRHASPETFRKELEDTSTAKAGMELKSLVNSLQREWNISLGGRLLDVELMHYVLDPERSHAFEDLTLEYLGSEAAPIAADQSDSLFGEDGDAAADFGTETERIASLCSRVLADLEASDDALKLYNGIEEPLLRVLSRMELNGVKVDVRSLKEFADTLKTGIVAEEAKVREIAGNPSLNLNSPKQIGELVFEQLKLDPSEKKSKTGRWPTDEETLSALADRSPVIDSILEYRGLTKLLNTYIEPFPGYISERDGRVHTTFNQALTSTGRLSSSNPNLQNIPIRTERGREIRKAFVAEKPGYVIMSADYSQIELRLMAHFSGDANLVAAFRSGQDVHASTASRIFHVPVEEVSADQRRMAKTVNFGIMYGMSAFGLAQRLKCPRGEAQQLIKDYFATFPSIRGWIDATLSKARTDGYVSTLLGRRRYVPDLNSSNGNIRALAERNAINAPIQGTAADIMKIAMIRVDKALAEAGCESRIVLQIHDELLLEVPEREVEKVSSILKEGMENAMELSVPLTVECNYGKNWLDAH